MANDFIPQKMFITGVSPGTPLAAALVSLWADVNWSPSCFDQIAAAYFDRIAPHNIRANLVTSEIAASTEARKRYATLL